ncbi:MAG: hypothetical protein MRY78_02205, partial [Saprospiraceae bacterium]|nr:hypothetical protein [Saprospiraceae bacterium]
QTCTLTGLSYTPFSIHFKLVGKNIFFPVLLQVACPLGYILVRKCCERGHAPRRADSKERS